MKKFIAILLVIGMMVCSAAYATELEGKTTEELIQMIEQLQAQLNQNQGETANEEGSESTEAEEDASPEYIELAKGSKGEEARNVQKRLIELGFLSGSADGVYGNGTAAAVSAFQSQHDLPATGTADIATQELLFSDEAEKAIVYEKLQYKAASRDPDDFEGRYVKFNGKILQAIEGDYRIAFLIYANDNYDQLVRVEMDRPDSYSRLLEDDRVTVMGQYAGLYSYKTVRGSENTVPQIDASLVTLR